VLEGGGFRPMREMSVTLKRLLSPCDAKPWFKRADIKVHKSC
jgi:hypothetical protein